MNSNDGSEMNLVNGAFTFEETKGKTILEQNAVMEEWMQKGSNRT